MKLFHLLKPAAICIMGALMFSCSGSDENPNNSTDPVTPVTPEDPVTPEENNAMSPLEQKSYLEKVGLEFINQVPASDFQYYVDFGEYFSDTYAEDYSWDAVQDWGEDSFEAIKTFVNTTNPKSGTYYDNYKALVLASNFTGCFTASGNEWVFTNDDVLSFVFTNEKGKKCVAKLVTDGDVTKVHYGEMKEYKKYESGSRYYDITDLTIGVPESITVTLDEDGKTLAEITLNIKLSQLNQEEFNISKSGLSVDFITNLNNGYQFRWIAEYTGNQSLSTSLYLTKNSTSLVAMAVAGDISGIPSWNVSDLVNGDAGDEDEIEDANAKNAWIKVDILGKVQVQGEVSDVRKYASYIEKAEDNYKDESLYKSYIGQANALAEVYVFYDGSSIKQASMRLEPFSETSYSTTSWYVEPIIEFYDGSSYSTFEAFFNEDDFKKLIDAFEDLIEDYENLL